MPKKSGKSKSKRMTLKQKYKIKKKVKDHHKKEKKKMKKLGIKPKGPKDPGLPSQWPFKEELIKEFAFKRAQILAAENAKKEAKKARRLAHKNGEDAEGDQPKVVVLTKAQKKAAARVKTDAEIKRAEFREFKQVVDAADIIIQVLDARDPLSCRCPEAEQYIHSTNPAKRVILVLNKTDLVPREACEGWLQLLRQEAPTLAFRASQQQQAAAKPARRGKAAADAKPVEEASTCLGADTLLQLLKSFCRSSGAQGPVTVGVVGLPNVGKRSLIGSLVSARAAQVESLASTSGREEEDELPAVQLDKHIRLLETPGTIVTCEESTSAAVLRSCVRVDRLQDPVAPVAEVLSLAPAKHLMQLYKIAAFKDSEQFLQLVAAAEGKLRKGQGTPDMQAAARVVLQDWSTGRIPYYTSPTSEPSTSAAGAGAEAAKAFDAEKAYEKERTAVLAHLSPLEGADDDAPGSGRTFFRIDPVGGPKVDFAAMEKAIEEDSEEEEEGEEEDEEEEEEEEEEEGAAPKKAKRAVTAQGKAVAGKEDEDGDFVFEADSEGEGEEEDEGESGEGEEEDEGEEEEGEEEEGDEMESD